MVDRTVWACKREIQEISKYRQMKRNHSLSGWLIAVADFSRYAYVTETEEEKYADS